MANLKAILFLYWCDINGLFDIPKAPAVSADSSGNRSGSVLLNFDSGEHQGPSGIHQKQQQQQQLGVPFHTSIH